MPKPAVLRTLFDTFTNPRPETYLTRRPFIIPLVTGGIKGVALNQTESKYIFSVYTLIIAGILGFVWQLVIYLALIFYPTEEGGRSKDQEKDGVVSGDERDSDLLKIRKRKANRYIALVMIWNAPNPWAAVFQLYGHAFTMIFDAKDKGTSLCDIIMIVIAIIVGAATAAASTLIPAHLQKGAFAPANPKAVFYAFSVDIPNADYVKFQQTKGAAGQRAIGIVEFASDSLQGDVSVYPPEVMDWTGPNGERIERTMYNYSVTGVDFGLQHKNAVNFVFSVTGACTLEYNWFNSSRSDSFSDVYDVYGTFQNVSKIGVVRPTGGTILFEPNADPSSSNRSYAIIPDTVGRLSLVNGTDPLYTTSDTPVIVNGFTYQVVKNRRPLLSCWQNDSWSYEGNSAQSIASMGSLPGLDLPDPIQNIFLDRLEIPIIRDIGASLGNSILISSQGGNARLFDASIANYTADFQRLIYASYVATQNIFRDSTMISQTYGIKNSAQDDTGVPLPGVGQFVIASGDVMALSVKNMTIIPLVWLLLWVIRFIASYTRYTSRNSGPASRLTLRAVALQPVQMYRLLDEQVCGYRDDWFRRKGKLPYIKEAQPVWPGNRSQTSENKATGTPITTEISTVEPAAEPPVQLFAAPKVVKGPDGEYQLGFAGPVGRGVPENNHGWVWFGKSPGASTVVDRPGGKDALELPWWKKIFGLGAGGNAIG